MNGQPNRQKTRLSGIVPGTVGEALLDNKHMLEAALAYGPQAPRPHIASSSRRWIQGVTGARLLTAHGTLYRALHGLEQAGFLESFWEDPRLALDQGRPTRRFYRVTAAGEQTLARAKAEKNAGLSSLTPRRATP